MRNIRAIIIDDDEMVRSILKRSLLSHHPGSQVLEVMDPSETGSMLQEQIFDVVIVDGGLLTEEGSLMKEFLEANPPGALVVTAYPNVLGAVQSMGIPVNYTLGKPFELAGLNQLVQNLLANLDDSPQGESFLSQKLYQESYKLLQSLIADTHARCIVLGDSQGRILQEVGTTQGIPIDAITALLGGGIATLLEAGRSVDDEAVINLTYREGKSSDLYAINVGDQFTLILVIDRGPSYNRLGTVWFYARQAALNLATIFKELQQAEKPDQFFSDSNRNAVSDELDKLFGEF
jgi:DNA-binding NarL/FixJ family response regulator